MNLSNFKIFNKILVASLLLAPLAFTSNPANAASSKYGTYSETAAYFVAPTWWITTKVTDQDGKDVTKDNQGVVGYANYKLDGSFQITDLSRKPRISGTWALTPDNKKRILVFKNQNGETITRIVEVTVATKNVFTYKIPKENGYVLVEHIPAK